MFWKIYFWFLVAFTALSILVAALATRELFGNIFDIFNMLFILLGLVGFYKLFPVLTSFIRVKPFSQFG